MNIETCVVKNYIDIGELRYHPRNSELRKISDDRFMDLKKSILDKGFYEPILIWKKNIILAGNHRVRAIKQLIKEGHTVDSPDGENRLPVVYEDCSEETALAILFESNNHYAEWIDDKLKEALKESDRLDLKSYGFANHEIDSMVREASARVDPVDIDWDEEAKPDILFIPPHLEKSLKDALMKFAPDHWEHVIKVLTLKKRMN